MAEPVLSVVDDAVFRASVSQWAVHRTAEHTLIGPATVSVVTTVTDAVAQRTTPQPPTHDPISATVVESPPFVEDVLVGRTTVRRLQDYPEIVLDTTYELPSA